MADEFLEMFGQRFIVLVSANSLELSKLLGNVTYIDIILVGK
jgi:hypothetical protein